MRMFQNSGNRLSTRSLRMDLRQEPSSKSCHALRRCAMSFLGVTLLTCIFTGCGSEAPPTGEAVQERDSLPVMTTFGVSKMISDSGVMRYKIVAEEWRVYDKTHPPRQTFPKGIFLTRFDEKLKVDLYITADTAYWYNQNLWEMRGRVFINNLTSQTTFATEELFWDMNRHEIYSNKHIHIVKPDEELEGNWFRSDENMNVYHVRRTSGFLPMPGREKSEEAQAADTLPPLRSAPTKTERSVPSMDRESGFEPLGN